MIELSINELNLVSGAGCIATTLSGMANGGQSGAILSGAVGLGVSAFTAGLSAPATVTFGGIVGGTTGVVGGGIATGYECYQESKQKDQSGNDYGNTTNKDGNAYGG